MKLLITVFCSKAADAKSISPAVPLYIANSLHCGLPLDCKMLIHISELPVQVLDGSADKCHVFCEATARKPGPGPGGVAGTITTIISVVNSPWSGCLLSA